MPRLRSGILIPGLSTLTRRVSSISETLTAPEADGESGTIITPTPSGLPNLFRKLQILPMEGAETTTTNDMKATEVLWLIRSFLGRKKGELGGRPVKEVGKAKEDLLKVFSLFGVSREDVEVGLKRYPLLLYKSSDAIESKLRYFSSLGMTDYQLGKMVAKAPTLMGSSLERNMAPRVEMLRNYGFTHENLCAMVSRSPTIFNNTTQEGLAQRLAFMHNLVGPEKFVSVVAVHPQLLLFNADTRWEAYQGAFKLVDLVEMTDFRRIAISCPRVMLLNIQKTLIPKIEALLDFNQGTGRSAEEARAMTKEIIRKNPMILGLSLQNRILPRLTVMKKKNWPFTITLFTDSDKEFFSRRTITLRATRRKQLEYLEDDEEVEEEEEEEETLKA